MDIFVFPILNFSQDFISLLGRNCGECTSKKLLITDTSIKFVMGQYAPFFKWSVEFKSFKSTDGNFNNCFKHFHSGGFLDLHNGYYLVNFYTKGPKFNLTTPLCFDYDIIGKSPTYQVRGLVIPESRFLIEDAFISKKDDIRLFSYNNNIYTAGVMSHLVMGGEVSFYDPRIKGLCTELSTHLPIINHASGSLRDFYTDLDKNPLNKLFIDSMGIDDRVGLEKYAHSLVSDKSLVLPDKLTIHYGLNQDIFLKSNNNSN
jgi:hypothetical protein